VVDDDVVQRDAATLQPGVIVRASVVARKPMAVWDGQRESDEWRGPLSLIIQ